MPEHFVDGKLLAEALSRCSMKQCSRLLRPCVIQRTVQCATSAARVSLSLLSIRGHGTKSQNPLPLSTQSTDVSDRLHDFGNPHLWPRIVPSQRKLTIRCFIEKYRALDEPEISSRAEEVVLHGTHTLQTTQMSPDTYLNRQSDVDSEGRLQTCIS